MDEHFLRVAIAIIALALVGCKKSTPAPPPPIRATSTTLVSPTDLLARLKTFSAKIPAAMAEARETDTKPDETWTFTVKSLDVLKSQSAVHPLEGVIVFDEMMKSEHVLLSAQYEIRLSPNGNGWSLEKATMSSLQGMMDGRDQNLSSVAKDITGSPLFNRMMAIANQK